MILPGDMAQCCTAGDESMLEKAREALLVGLWNLDVVPSTWKGLHPKHRRNGDLQVEVRRM